MSFRKQTITWGIAAVVVVLAVVSAPSVALPLLAIAVLLFLWGLKTGGTMREDELIHKEVQSLMSWGYKPHDLVSHFQSHLDALDSKMWNSLLSTVGYASILMTMLAAFVLFDEDQPKKHIYIYGYSLVALLFVFSISNLSIILPMVGRAQWFSVSKFQDVEQYCAQMAELRDKRTRLLKIAYRFNLLAIISGVLYVLWWGVITLLHSECLEWLHLKV